MEVLPLRQTFLSSSRPSVSCCQSVIHCGIRCSRALPSTPAKGGRMRVKMATECASLGPGAVAREFEDEMGVEEVAEWMKSGRLKEKCGGGRGVVELLECLEREAIMGEDHGREPNDYNRRAQIFDRSSRVFQALRERDSTASAADDVQQS
ncbi:uncharacterized protein LOC133798121 [Humulus lupulus]|uniref:uncharacterized protein LOC133798121 n=1 Tax=Humulus lupulus TaxID=3486 RepID=UPI002B4100D9|nr:uncharacterized protein LOC133798121 [Humulus lupulus]